MSNNWPPSGTQPSGLPAYCDIRNPNASKSACMTGGGTAYANNLCNIINPNTNVDQCNASLKTSSAFQDWAVNHLGIFITLLILGVFIGIGVLYMWQQMTYGVYGGGRSGGFKSVFKSLKLKF